MNVVGYERGL